MELTLKIKLASMYVHLEELFSPYGHDADKAALQTILDDPEVKEFIESLDKAFLPVKRNAGKEG